MDDDLRRNRESVVNLAEAKVKRLLRWLATEIKLECQIHPGFKMSGLVDPSSALWLPDERAYAYTGSFDFLITVEEQDGREAPLMAVDFHGPVHAQPAKARKDAIKQEICRRAGITYLAFTPDDLEHSSPDDSFPYASYQGHFKAIEVMSHLRRLRLEHRLRNRIEALTPEVEAAVRRAVADGLEIITTINAFGGCLPEWLEGHNCAETRIRNSKDQTLAIGYGWCPVHDPLAHLKASVRSVWDALLIYGYIRHPTNVAVDP